MANLSFSYYWIRLVWWCWDMAFLYNNIKMGTDYTGSFFIKVAHKLFYSNMRWKLTYGNCHQDQRYGPNMYVHVFLKSWKVSFLNFLKMYFCIVFADSEILFVILMWNFNNFKQWNARFIRDGIYFPFY